MIHAVSDNPAYARLLAAIDEALECLSGKRFSDKHVHAARKAVKKARAALRLLRPAMTETAYRKENAALRDAGRTLSPLRDAKSLLDTFDAFVSRYAAELRGVELARLHRWLLARRTLARRELIKVPGNLRQFVDSLEGCRKRMRQSQLARAEPATAMGGLRRIYRKGRKAFARAKSLPRTRFGNAHSSKTLHEWRKQVKYLVNGVAALRCSDARPRIEFGAGCSHKLAKRADRVAAWLGDDHDLAMLHEAVRDSAIENGAVTIICGLIARRRAKLQARAFDRGHKLFARKPKRFAPCTAAHANICR